LFAPTFLRQSGIQVNLSTPKIRAIFVKVSNNLCLTLGLVNSQKAFFQAGNLLLLQMDKTSWTHLRNQRVYVLKESSCNGWEIDMLSACRRTPQAKARSPSR